MKLYSYNGPVEEFGKCIANNWKAETYAASPSKARSNLTFRFKKEFSKATNAKISLPGKLVAIEDKEAS